MACAKLWAISAEYQKEQEKSTYLRKTALIMVVFHFLTQRNGSSTVFANGKQNSPTIRFVQISNVPFTKARPNDRNTPTQHIATLLGAACCLLLITMSRPVGRWWFKFDHLHT